jgi:restriction system protein
MSVKDAAIQVLQDAGGALTAQEIAERVLAGGLWQTSGKTPHATVAAALYTDIKRHGGGSAFTQPGPNTFALRNGVATPGPASTPTTTTTPAAQYSFTDAAEKVLEQFGDKKPMHYRLITQKALSLGWIVTEGRTPEATMYAQILTEVKRYQRRGEQARFVQHARAPSAAQASAGDGPDRIRRTHGPTAYGDRIRRGCGHPS